MTPTVHQFGPEHEVAHGPHGTAAWPGKPGGHRAAEGRAVAEIGRLERQQLIAFCERCFNVGQWRAAAGGDDQFRRVIGDDATVVARVQHVAHALLAVPRLGAAPPQLEGRAVRRGVLDDGAEVLESVVRIGHQLGSGGGGRSD